MHLVRSIGGITVRGNHDEMALERYDTWKRTGALDVRAHSSFARCCVTCLPPPSLAHVQGVLLQVTNWLMAHIACRLQTSHKANCLPLCSTDLKACGLVHALM